MRNFVSLLIVFILVGLCACGKGESKKKKAVDAPDEPTPICNPAPGPQPDPGPVIPDPGPNPDPEPEPEPEPEPVPEPPVPPVPAPLPPEKTFKVNVTFTGSMATTARKAKYMRAVCLVKKVIALPEMKSKVVGFDSPYTVNMYVSSSKKPADIWKHILQGNESLQQTIDNEMDVEIEFYYANTSVIGYTYANSKRVWVNTKFFDTYTPKSVASNLMHEWLHKLGYVHAASYSDSRNYSVPYAIGSMVRTLGGPLESSCP